MGFLGSRDWLISPLQRVLLLICRAALHRDLLCRTSLSGGLRQVLALVFVPADLAAMVGGTGLALAPRSSDVRYDCFLRRLFSSLRRLLLTLQESSDLRLGRHRRPPGLVRDSLLSGLLEGGAQTREGVATGERLGRLALI